MIRTMSGAEAIQRRRVINSPGTDRPHWGTEYFGERWPDENAKETGPQSLMTELDANEYAMAHYHGLDQFQIFAAGTGKMGRTFLQPLTLQFKDHHTAYGPFTAGPQGLTFFSMRMTTANAAPVFVNTPGYKEKLRPSKRRNLISSPLSFSTEPVLMNLAEPIWEPIAPFDQHDDGLMANLVRLGANMSVMGPDPKRSAGYYLFVCNGSLDLDGKAYPLWSMVVVEPEDGALEIKSGNKGLEVLILEFPIKR